MAATVTTQATAGRIGGGPKGGERPVTGRG